MDSPRKYIENNICKMSAIFSGLNVLNYDHRQLANHAEISAHFASRNPG